MADSWAIVGRDGRRGPEYSAAADAFTLYDDARDLIRHGDLLLFRSPRFSIIDAGGRFGGYTHCELAAWHGSLGVDHAAARIRDQRLLLSAGFREFQGSRILSLSQVVTDNPGRIDVFRPKCSSLAAALAAEIMLKQAGKRYGKWALARAALFHFPGTAWVAHHYWDPTNTTPADWADAKFCSQAAIWCYRRAAGELGEFFDPVPGLADWAVEPIDLRRSFAFERIATRLVHNLNPELAA